MAVFHGSKHDDNLTGTSSDDTFDLYKGGSDTASGGDGDDRFNMGASLDAGDRIDGGTGSDVIFLHGDYSANVTFDDRTIQNIEVLKLGKDFDYNLTTADGNVAAGETLSVNARSLGAANSLTFDGSQESDGHFAVYDGAGSDTISGGALGDRFYLSAGGNDTVQGGGGNDVFAMGGALTVADRIDGGTGHDTVMLDGDYHSGVTFSATTITGIETLKLLGSGQMTITLDDANVAAGAVLTVNADAATGAIGVNGSAEQDAAFHFIAGHAVSNFAGGAQSDVFDMLQGPTAIVQGSGGDDTINFGTNWNANADVNGGSGSDTLTFTGDYTNLQIDSAKATAVETVQFLGGHSYTGVSITGDVADGSALTIDAGGAGNLSIDLSGAASAAYTVIGGSGADAFRFGGNFSASDSVDGGGSNDTLELNGDYSSGLIFGAATMTNVETLKLDGGFSYKLATDDATVASGATLTVDSSALGAAHGIVFDASAETNGVFAITGGAGDDTVTFGARAVLAGSTIDGGAGHDTLILDGDFSTNLVFGATTVTNIEEIDLVGGHSYSLATDNGSVASLLSLTVDASGLLADDALTFNGSAELDGSFTITDGAGDDALTGGAQADIFRLQNGGTDTVQGGGGNDSVFAFGTLTAADRLDGGTGSNQLHLDGDYTGGNALVLGAATVTNFSEISFASGHSYNVTTHNATVAAGQTLQVDVQTGATDAVTFDGSAETDGRFSMLGGAGNDALTGGALSDTFDMSSGGNDTVHGGGGDDTIAMAGTLSTADAIDGGTGNDTVSIVENGTIVLGATTLTNVENLRVTSNSQIHLTTDDATVASGATMTVDFSASNAAAGVYAFDGGAETDGHFAVVGPAGASSFSVTGGALSDAFTLGNDGTSDNTVHGNGGNDILTLTSLAMAVTYDGGTGNDTLSLTGGGTPAMGGYTLTSVETLKLDDSNWNVTTIDGNVTAGATLTVDAGALGAGHTLTFDGSAETNGAFAVIGGAGDDAITGGAGNDGFNFALGGNDTGHGGGGNDTFSFGAAFTAADTVDGGANTDTISLNGDYSAGLTLGAATITSIENIVMAAGHSYSLTTNDANVASGASLAVDASALGASDALTFDGLAETNGSFAVTGGAGNDSVVIGARAVLAGSTIDGGAGSDTLTLNGNYSTSLTLGANTIRNIETIVFAPVNSNYILISNDATVAGGQTLTLDASSLTRALSWNASAETDAFFNFKGGAGSDVLILSSEAVLAGSTFDGGSAGNNVLELNGDFSAHFTFAAGTITNVQNLTLDRNHSYDLKTVDANIAGGGSLFVNGLALVSTDTIRFDGSAETDGHFTLEGGQGGDTLIGGAGNDTIWGYVGADTMTGGAGADTFFYTFAVGSGVAESTSTHYDTITDIDFSVDKIDPPSANGHVTEVDPAILGGTLSTASFDADLANAVNGTGLAVNGAVLFTADAGTLANHTFLVVDENGIAGYQAGADLVIDVTGYAGTLTTGSFI